MEFIITPESTIALGFFPRWALNLPSLSYPPHPDNAVGFLRLVFWGFSPLQLPTHSFRPSEMHIQRIAVKLHGLKCRRERWGFIFGSQLSAISPKYAVFLVYLEQYPVFCFLKLTCNGKSSLLLAYFVAIQTWSCINLPGVGVNQTTVKTSSTKAFKLKLSLVNVETVFSCIELTKMRN